MEEDLKMTQKKAKEEEDPTKRRIKTATTPDSNQKAEKFMYYRIASKNMKNVLKPFEAVSKGEKLCNLDFFQVFDKANRARLIKTDPSDGFKDYPVLKTSYQQQLESAKKLTIETSNNLAKSSRKETEGEATSSKNASKVSKKKLNVTPKTAKGGAQTTKEEPYLLKSIAPMVSESHGFFSNALSSKSSEDRLMITNFKRNPQKKIRTLKDYEQWLGFEEQNQQRRMPSTPGNQKNEGFSQIGTRAMTAACLQTQPSLPEMPKFRVFAKNGKRPHPMSLSRSGNSLFKASFDH